MHQPLSLSWLREPRIVPQHSLFPRKRPFSRQLPPPAGFPCGRWPAPALTQAGADARMIAALTWQEAMRPLAASGRGESSRRKRPSVEVHATMTWTTLLTFASAGQHECGTCDFVRPGEFHIGINRSARQRPCCRNSARGVAQVRVWTSARAGTRDLGPGPAPGQRQASARARAGAGAGAGAYSGERAGARSQLDHPRLWCPRLWCPRLR